MRYLILLLALAACPRPQPPVPPGPADAGATCADVCANLRRLSCPGAENTPEGATCEDVCQNIQDSGIIAWDLECRTSAQSCAAVDRCEE